MEFNKVIFNKNISEEEKMPTIVCDICDGNLTMDSNEDFALCDS